ncbi:MULTISPECIES: hypothetical protein [Kosakonia]|jgi:hypothetical protein|uniref:Uncharacterized protein n=1 Tax=Kosakonia cowanii JCM 10956 = DSM 18146 TaxID=1300165 RepID=A0A807LH61_9ENTR|nr:MULTISPECIES: hypothetical protein [Kosakonia]MBS5772186.1 hypothetical protein [Enterobacter cloacae]MDP9768489.1 hypothetical protein [Atlantibacter hermannii]MDT3413764.1 hypothetical protein [Atlantibacter sp. SORGH_AS_0304]MDV5353742.1 hypothetical protein [Enterobacter asburiae]APZ04742.1 hypothetical protein BWI95_06570 [Kosakonia cowanii JCM 10956 = DSM 18146]
MKNKKIDTMARVAMRIRGLSVKEKRLRYQDKMFTFKYVSGHYEVFLDGEKVDTFATENINQAIADFKEKNNKNRR